MKDSLVINNKAGIIFDSNSGFGKEGRAKDQQSDHPIGSSYPCYVPPNPSDYNTYNERELALTHFGTNFVKNISNAKCIVLFDFTREDADSFLGLYKGMFWGSIAMFCIGGPISIFGKFVNLR